MATRLAVTLVAGIGLLVAGCGNDDAGEGVELRSSTVTWSTYAYELTPFNTILAGSFDGETTTDRVFDTWVLENEYLQVTLLPEFGGRILSIVYTPTGHEQLYQNPVGVPYQIDTGVFYYDWLMVYGGIFPTFPEPEHGKAWFLPWEFSVVEERPDSVTVAMQFTDTITHVFAPSQYHPQPTGLRLTYLITLEAGRAALDTTVLIENPTDGTVEFEYWTNVTLAPGSDPGAPAATAQAEIIAPIDEIVIPPYWTAIAAAEDLVRASEDVHTFDALRVFGNWPDMGIAYASPDAADTGFWGVIDQARGEGLFRIADNTVTPGLKLWTWGYDRSVDADPSNSSDEARPYVELWAGLTDQFFDTTTIAPGASIRIDETYGPSVGLRTVTHATERLLVAVDAHAPGTIALDLFGFEPDHALTVSVIDGDATVFEDVIDLSPTAASEVTVPVPGDVPETLRLRIEDDSGTLVMDERLDLPPPAP